MNIDMHYFTLTNLKNHKQLSGFIEIEKNDTISILIYLLDVPIENILNYLEYNRENIKEPEYVAYISATISNDDPNDLHIQYVDTSVNHRGYKYGIYLLYLVATFANGIVGIHSITLDDATGVPAIYTNSNGKIRKNLYYNLGFKIKNSNDNWVTWKPTNSPDENRYITLKELLNNPIISEVYNLYKVKEVLY
jgi:hypothetical protein